MVVGNLSLKALARFQYFSSLLGEKKMITIIYYYYTALVIIYAAVINVYRGEMYAKIWFDVYPDRSCRARRTKGEQVNESAGNII